MSNKETRHTHAHERALPRVAEQRHQPKRHRGISSITLRRHWFFRRDAVQELLTIVNTKNDLVRLPDEDTSQQQQHQHQSATTMNDDMSKHERTENRSRNSRTHARFAPRPRVRTENRKTSIDSR